MISPRLLAIVRCPDCGGTLDRPGPDLRCGTCARRFVVEGREFLDLRPTEAYAETTKYVDEALHADARHETVSPPLLSAAVRYDLLRKCLGIGPGDRVLDLGCGSGRVLVWSRDAGAELIGVDVSPYFAAEARAAVDLIVGDLRRLPLADACVTKAVCLDVLEHLTIDAVETVLAEAARVLAPGGALFVYSHVRKNSRLAVGLRWINRVAGRLERAGLIDLRQERLRKSDHLNPLADYDDLDRVTRGAGFRLARIHYYTPLVGGVVENLLVRMGEQIMARRAGTAGPAKAGRPRDGAKGDSPRGQSPPEAGLRDARLQAKRQIARRGPVYAAMKALTWAMKLDVVLFGRVRSGPFFALLVKEDRRSG